MIPEQAGMVPAFGWLCAAVLAAAWVLFGGQHPDEWR